jgi:hypothetical protein
LDKNNERPDWMTDLKHTLTPHGKKMHVKEIFTNKIHPPPPFSPFFLFKSMINNIPESNK